MIRQKFKIKPAVFILVDVKWNQSGVNKKVESKVDGQWVKCSTKKGLKFLVCKSERFWNQKVDGHLQRLFWKYNFHAKNLFKALWSAIGQSAL